MNKFSITIGIPAYNEEKNIGKILDSLILQSAGNFTFDSIRVLCAGCTDNTVSIAESYQERINKLVIIKSPEKIGKIEKLNSLFKTTESDIIISLDADIHILDNSLIEKLVDAFSKSPETGLVGGLIIPEVPQTLSEKIFLVWNEIWNKALVNSDKSVHRLYGAIFALDKKLYKNLAIPKEIIAEDEFLYFENKKRGLQFIFLNDAIVYFKLPKTFREYFRQSARYITTKYKMFEYFGRDIEKDYKVPISAKIRAIFLYFIKKPFLTISAVILQCFVLAYCRFCPVKYENNVWEVAKSTK